MLSPAAMTVANFLGMRGGSLELDEGLAAYVLNTHNLALADVVLELVDSSAFGRSENELHVIAEATTLGHFDDGSGVVALDREKLDRWCQARELNPTYMTIIAT